MMEPERKRAKLRPVEDVERRPGYDQEAARARVKAATIRETRYVWRCQEQDDERPRFVSTTAYLRARRRRG